MKTLDKFDLILDLMECFPSAFAQPDNNISPTDIMLFAADYRLKAGLPPREQHPEPGTGALPPPDFVRPEAWDNPQLYDDPVAHRRYSGNCNGCGAPIYIPIEWGDSKKTISAADAVKLLETTHMKQDTFVGMGVDPWIYLYVKRKAALKPIKAMFDDYSNVVVEYHGPVVVKG